MDNRISKKIRNEGFVATDDNKNPSSLIEEEFFISIHSILVHINGLKYRLIYLE